MDELTRKRLEHNEAVFRSVNEEIDDHGERFLRRYVCECADAGCSATIVLSHDEYTAIRANPRRFVVLPGHELPELEEVVERDPDHLVVEKY